MEIGPNEVCDTQKVDRRKQNNLTSTPYMLGNLASEQPTGAQKGLMEK